MTQDTPGRLRVGHHASTFNEPEAADMMNPLTFNNFNLGIAVMIEETHFAVYKLTHVSFDVDYPEDGNTVIEVKTYNAGNLSRAIEYAKMCVSDTVPPGTFISVNC